MGLRYVGGELVTQMLAWDKRSEDGFLVKETFHTKKKGLPLTVGPW